MKRGRAFPVLALLGLVAYAPACGYRLAGQLDVLPKHIKVIAVVPFENRTDRPEIEQRVTEAVARELSRRGRQTSTNRDTADAVLEGVVTTYRTSPVEFNAQGRETRAEAVVTIQASLRETLTDEVLWNQSGLIFKEQFEVSQSAATGTYFDRESLALDALASGVAGVLATSMFEGF